MQHRIKRISQLLNSEHPWLMPVVTVNVRFVTRVLLLEVRLKTLELHKFEIIRFHQCVLRLLNHLLLFVLPLNIDLVNLLLYLVAPFIHFFVLFH